MYEWHESVQKMIEWIEDHIQENPTLLEMSKQIGYSPYYCSAQFHQIVGMTLKNYMAGRRLCYATIELRDTKLRILDVAVKAMIGMKLNVRIINVITRRYSDMKF